jgi:dolichol-phosphate mannosyltransferase
MPIGVSVVLPVFNNAPVLLELERRIRSALADRPLQIVMVDDGSRDDSLGVIRSLSVDCLALPENRGQNCAILAGLRVAREPITCVMDADLEDPPDVLPRLVTRLEQGDARVVFSTRETASPLSSQLFRWLIHRLFPTLPAVPCLFFALDQTTREARRAPRVARGGPLRLRHARSRSLRGSGAPLGGGIAREARVTDCDRGRC